MTESIEKQDLLLSNHQQQTFKDFRERVGETILQDPSICNLRGGCPGGLASQIGLKLI